MTVFGGQSLHNVVNRFKLVSVVLHLPSRQLLNVMSGFRLRFRRNRKEIL